MFLEFISTLLGTCLDLAPIVGLVIGFQVLLFRTMPPQPERILAGFLMVLLGLALFLLGLEKALFPIGRTMAEQLSNPAFLLDGKGASQAGWADYYWVYIFAAAIGFSTTIAEPSLLAVALKASEVSRGTIRPFSLRVAVAIGVAVGISLGTFRIVVGWPLVWFIVVGYVIVMVQTLFAPKMIVPLAYDSGGVTTSTVTVPLVAALGLGLASHIPGRNPAIDGFGLIAFASLFPMMTVMGYAQLATYLSRRQHDKENR